MSFPRSGQAARNLSAAAMSALLLASARQHFRSPGFYRQVVPDFLCREDPSAAAGGRTDSTAGTSDGGPNQGAPSQGAPRRPLAVLSREEWIAASGLLELAAAVGILVPQTRKVAATGLAAMFTAFLAGHVDALRRAYGPNGTPAQRKIHTLRLPLQAPLILWAWSLRKPAPVSAAVRFRP
ncbi:DoxX family protein [Pseudarthrobacter sp. NS4]|uniref:DoxX family protein n=1 Tax=Pseudarthrobacter sp. NS4 TaxID=2973976 RepID=UPI0021631B8B|nr:hypothetical protein [Pseudarthrobacter sp. NS4]